MTFKELCEQGQDLAATTKQPELRVKGQNGLVALVRMANPKPGAGYWPISPWLPNGQLARWMDAYRMGYQAAEQQRTPKV